MVLEYAAFSDKKFDDLFLLFVCQTDLIVLGNRSGGCNNAMSRVREQSTEPWSHSSGHPHRTILDRIYSLTLGASIGFQREYTPISMSSKVVSSCY